MRKFCSVIFIIVSVFISNLSAQTNLIDEVHLKNGTKIKGNIIEQSQDTGVKIQTSDSSLIVFTWEQISRIIKVDAGEQFSKPKLNIESKIQSNENTYNEEALKQNVYTLSGSFSLGTYNSGTDNSTYKSLNVTISPSFNYFIVDNLLIGASLYYYYNETEYSSKYSNYKNSYNRLSIGPSVKYFFRYKGFIPFVGSDLSYSSITDDSYTTFGIQAGICLFLSKTAALEPYVMYNTTSGNGGQNHFELGLRISQFIL